MSEALTEILLHRQRILSRVGQQRDSVVVAVAALARPIAVVDRLVQAGRVLRAHPAAVVTLFAAVFAFRARTLIRLVGRGIGVWRTLRSLRALIRQLAN